MAQANLKHLVEDANLRVQRARRYVDRQREAVSSLEQTNQDATTAKRLLAISKKAFEIHLADRVRLTQSAGRAVREVRTFKIGKTSPILAKAVAWRIHGPNWRPSAPDRANIGD